MPRSIPFWRRLAGRSRWYAAWQSLAGIDPRTLAAFRIGLGAVLLADLATRAVHLGAHYTDRGILPRIDLLGEATDLARPSLHLASGGLWGQGVLFLAAAAAALALVAGWRTRWAALASWILLMSLQARNPVVLHGGDDLLRMLLFWALFLPLGDTWSLDRILGPRLRGTGELVATAASLAIRLQVCLLYWFSAVNKAHAFWLVDGTAVERALKIDQLSTSFGRALLEFPGLLRIATHGTIVLEVLGPLVALAPITPPMIRLLVVLVFWAFHLLGLGLALHLGPFPWICAVAWIVFLPPQTWDWIRGRSRRVQSRQGAPPPEVASEASAPARSQPRRPAFAWVQPSVLALLMLYIVAWNLRDLDREKYGLLPAASDRLGYALGLEQSWSLFAPIPSTEDGWLAASGRLVDGGRVEVLSGRHLDGAGDPPADAFAKPPNNGRRLGSSRWRKYLINLGSQDFAPHRRYFSRYLCRRWQDAHPEGPTLEALDLYFVLERTLPSGEEDVPRPRRLWTEACLNR